mmetsp:Transcript_5324/g.6270  ORF Transcript_5324/g.6270 Transcript_5324/m.6270 type:complete len:90 (-) Transcript_5324:43-312(-)
MYPNTEASKCIEEQKTNCKHTISTGCDRVRTTYPHPFTLRVLLLKASFNIETETLKQQFHMFFRCGRDYIPCIFDIDQVIYNIIYIIRS